jgi:[ribosomal protein S5]-alanine N-acetyltransferase
MRVPLLYATNTALLATPNLRLRPLVPDDGRHFAELLGADPAAIAMLSHMPEPLTVEAAREWIELRTGPGGHVFAVRLADGTFVGTSGFGGPRDGVPGFGYWIGAPFRGRGYATEAGNACIAHARRLGVRRMVAETFPGNAASVRVLEKLGFLAEGPVERNYPLRGGWRTLTLHNLDIPELIV